QHTFVDILRSRSPMTTKKQRDNRRGLSRIGLAVVMPAALGLAVLTTLFAAEPNLPVGERARQLAADIVSPDAKVREKTAIDLVNGEFRAMSDGDRLAIVMAAIQTPDLDPKSKQGLVLES